MYYNLKPIEAIDWTSVSYEKKKNLPLQMIVLW